MIKVVFSTAEHIPGWNHRHINIRSGVAPTVPDILTKWGEDGAEVIQVTPERREAIYKDVDDTLALIQEHLIKQGRPSQTEEGAMCMYRGCGGTMCAVGALIADEHYHPHMEGSSVSAEGVSNALRASGVNLDTQLMVFALQQAQAIHDTGRILSVNDSTEFPGYAEYIDYAFRDLRARVQQPLKESA